MYTSKIEHGVSGADYVGVALSTGSVKSGWVEREWKKYWEEIERNKTLVLPVLIENCEIPPLLKIKIKNTRISERAMLLGQLNTV